MVAELVRRLPDRACRRHRALAARRGRLEKDATAGVGERGRALHRRGGQGSGPVPAAGARAKGGWGRRGATGRARAAEPGRQSRCGLGPKASLSGASAECATLRPVTLVSASAVPRTLAFPACPSFSFPEPLAARRRVTRIRLRPRSRSPIPRADRSPGRGPFRSGPNGPNVHVWTSCRSSGTARMP